MPRYYLRWRTKDGRTLALGEIGDDHLANIIAKLKRDGDDEIHYGCSGPSADDMYYDSDPNPMYLALVREYRRRKLPILKDQ